MGGGAWPPSRLGRFTNRPYGRDLPPPAHGEPVEPERGNHERRPSARPSTGSGRADISTPFVLSLLKHGRRRLASVTPWAVHEPPLRPRFAPPPPAHGEPVEPERGNHERRPSARPSTGSGRADISTPFVLSLLKYGRRAWPPSRFGRFTNCPYGRDLPPPPLMVSLSNQSGEPTNVGHPSALRHAQDERGWASRTLALRYHQRRHHL